MQTTTPVLLATLFLCAAANGASDDLAARGAKLAEDLPRMAERARVPGVSIALANAEGVVWQAAIGKRNASADGAVDADTVFEAASLSKPVFAYTVLQLVDEGVLELDTALVEYAPLDDIASDPRHAQLTARMVLSHSTGLPNWRPSGGALEFAADPGQAWRYSGEGFVLLQHVVETLVGDTLQGLAQDLVFEPLGMTRSSFVWRPEFAQNVALPHDEAGANREIRQLQVPNAAYSLLTTASDYARFLAALLRGARLKDATHAALLTRQIDVSPGVAWGLGVGLEASGDGAAFWHWGHNSGYRAFAIAVPERDFAAVYFANSDNGMRFLRDVVGVATGNDVHPSLDHLDYPSYDDAE